MVYNSGGIVNGPGRVTPSDSGIREQFRERGRDGNLVDTHNQVRHFVGGYVAAATQGYLPARIFMNGREDPTTEDGRSDLAVNGISLELGRRTGMPIAFPRGLNYARRRLADEIRKQFCE